MNNKIGKWLIWIVCGYLIFILSMLLSKIAISLSFYFGWLLWSYLPIFLYVTYIAYKNLRVDQVYFGEILHWLGIIGLTFIYRLLIFSIDRYFGDGFSYLISWFEDLSFASFISNPNKTYRFLQAWLISKNITLSGAFIVPPTFAYINFLFFITPFWIIIKKVYQNISFS